MVRVLALSLSKGEPCGPARPIGVDFMSIIETAPRPRHPEKAHRPDNPVRMRKPDWIRV